MFMSDEESTMNIDLLKPYLDESGSDNDSIYYDVIDGYEVCCNDNYNVVVVQVNINTKEITHIHDDVRGQLGFSDNATLEVIKIERTSIIKIG